MDDADGKKILELIEQGFKEVNEKLATIQLERQYEKGLKLEERVQKNMAEIDALKEWKITTNTTVANSRRFIWGLISALGTLIVGFIIAIITYGLGHWGKS